MELHVRYEVCRHQGAHENQEQDCRREQAKNWPQANTEAKPLQHKDDCSRRHESRRNDFNVVGDLLDVRDPHCSIEQHRDHDAEAEETKVEPPSMDPLVVEDDVWEVGGVACQRSCQDPQQRLDFRRALFDSVPMRALQVLQVFVRADSRAAGGGSVVQRSRRT